MSMALRSLPGRSGANVAIACALVLLCSGIQAGPLEAIGRAPTPAELKAWNIDVRADLQGLPKGSGSVAQGEVIWEGKCASCHGSFGESNQTFPPLVGGTTAADIKNGHTASLFTGDVPQRSTMMKLARISTLWDYINRAMPWNAPKSLSTDEVYAATAYLLRLAEIVPENFTLSDRSMGEVQKLLPNRDGLTLRDDMWTTRGKGDVHNIACMKNCETEVRIASFLPESARNAHGNLAEQNRLIGPVRGTVTAPAKPVAVAATTATVAAAVPASATAIPALLKANHCSACHGIDTRIVGPGFKEIAAKYQAQDKDQPERERYLTNRIRHGGAGLWGAVPMPPQPQVAEADLRTIAAWLAAGAK